MRLVNHGGPSGGAKPGGARMAGGGEYRRQKNRLGTGAAGAMHIHQPMGGTGDATPRAQIGGLRAGPAPGAQMHPGAQGVRQTNIPRDDEHKVPGAANAGQGTADSGAIRRAVMAENHPAQVFRQPGGGGERVHATGCVREQP